MKWEWATNDSVSSLPALPVPKRKITRVKIFFYLIANEFC
jgi:hypothetical protein